MQITFQSSQSFPYGTLSPHQSERFVQFSSVTHRQAFLMDELNHFLSETQDRLAAVQDMKQLESLEIDFFAGLQRSYQERRKMFLLQHGDTQQNQEFFDTFNHELCGMVGIAQIRQYQEPNAPISRQKTGFMQMLEQLRECGQRYQDFWTQGLERQNCPVADLYHMAIASVKPQIAQKHIRLQKPATVPAYPLARSDFMVYTVLSNLLQNAVKFTPEGGAIKVGMSTVPSGDQPDGQDFLLTVQDTGIGIPVSDQSQVMLGIRGSNVGDIPGFGSGLYRVSHWVKDLKIESDPAKRPGTKITCSIPIMSGNAR